MNALQKLRDMALQDIQQRHPDNPFPPRPKYADRSANDLTRCIIHYIRLSRGQAERVSCTGRTIRGNRINPYTGDKVPGADKWIPTNMTAGTADISATWKGRSIKIEVKIGRDRQSEKQRRYQQQVEASGGVYYIAIDFQSFFEWWNKLK